MAISPSYCLIPSLPDDVVKREIFPFLQNTNLVTSRRVNRAWKEVIDTDPRWVAMGKKILGRGIEINLDKPLSCKRALMGFCIQVDKSFPRFFPGGPQEIMDELPKALEKLSLQIAISHGLTMSLRMKTTPYVMEEKSEEEIEEHLQKAHLAKVACSQSDKETCLALAMIADEKYVPRVISSLEINNLPPSFIQQVVDYCPQHEELIRHLVKGGLESQGSE